MKHAPPAPPALGTQDGLAYALFLPDAPPTAGVVILHGAGSAKENHFDFARAARAAGMAALAFDARGHGASAGDFGPTAFGDVLAMCDLLRTHAPAVAIRGSSMGGFCAIHAAALEPRTTAVVAICPAPAESLLRGARAGRFEARLEPLAVLEPWLAPLRLTDAAARLGPATSLLLLHARGDEQVPYTVSEEVHRAASSPKRLLIFPGGHHRSLQHDQEVQAESLRFIAKAAGRAEPV